MPSVPLKPCPFCGAKGKKLRLGRWASDRKPYSGYVVECDECVIVGPYRATSEAARKAWNERASASIAEIIEYLREVKQRAADVDKPGLSLAVDFIRRRFE